MKLVYLLLFLLLPACANMPGIQYQGMSPEAITASVKDKNASANCYEFIGAGGKVSVMTVNNDAGTIKSGSATVECAGGKATFTNGEKKP